MEMESEMRKESGMKKATEVKREVAAVIFDWAGTTIDYGCFAPLRGFIEGFKGIGITITPQMARRPMGLAKIDHVRAIAAMLPQVLTEAEILAAYRIFEETLFAEIENYCDIKEHVLETVAILRENNIKIGSSTGYTKPMMAKILPKAAALGYEPDFWISPDQLPQGRPAPYMIWQNMMHFGMTDPRMAVKVGDTTADIEEGKNAGCWTVAVIMGSSELGFTKDEVAAMDAGELKLHAAKTRARFYEAGADFIISEMIELPLVIYRINQQLAETAPHKLLTPGPLSTRQSVKKAMLTDHCTWDDEYKAITASVTDDITKIAADDSYATVLLQGSGSYAVEAMINCFCPPKEKILFLVNGEYGKRMLTMAGNSSRTYESMIFDMTRPIDVERVENKLKNDGNIKTVILVHCETTTGVLNPLAEVVRLAKRYRKKVLVDAMSSFAAYEIDMPDLDIDALAASSNKCLEGMPGLSFVIAKKTLLNGSKGQSGSHCLDLYDQYQGLYENGGKIRFTSPTTIMLALRQALDEYKKEGGLTARQSRYRENHQILVEGLEKAGIHAIVPPENQSYIITTFALGDLDFADFYQTLKARGFVIYPGKLTDIPTFRLGNIGDVYPADMERLAALISEYAERN